MEIVNASVSTRGFPIVNTDSDITIRLDRADVDTLNNDATRALIAAKLTAAISAVGAIAAIYVNERITQIAEGSGPNGCDVEITIRNGTSLREFKIHAR